MIDDTINKSQLPLKEKVELALIQYLRTVVSLVPVASGQDAASDQPERCVLVWAKDVTLFAEMPFSTGVRIVPVVVRVEYPIKESQTERSLLVSDVIASIENLDAVQALLNKNGQDPDLRDIQGLHIYDIDITGAPDMRDSEFFVQELTLSVLTGEHDG